MKNLTRCNWFSTALFGLCISQVVTAQETQNELLSDNEFQQCVVEISERAEREGVGKKVIDDALGQANYLKNVIGYDRNQPESVQSFPNYFSKRVTAWRIDKGREMYNKHREFLIKQTSKYGIPAHYLIAFWGLETNYGTYKGKMSTIDSLATLACDPRRSKFFTQELITALKLMERENFVKASMLGSWAGAMGHTQFMPSAYIAYAIDGDDDGTVDLWNSEEDALASAANFLNQLGWQRGYRWGREVKLPTGFDYSLTGRNQKHSLAQWKEKDVVKVNGKAFAANEMKASVLIPAGHEGPAFMVYDNFKIIMRWNNSESYAIAVGHLADRILGAGPLVQPLPNLDNYQRSEMVALQNALNLMGIDVGKADGIFGSATRNGIQTFQSANNMVADGFPSSEVFAAIKAVAKVAM